jgi:hypothetical protein
MRIAGSEEQEAIMMRIDVSAFVRAPQPIVMDVYTDYANWAHLFPTIKGVRLIRREGNKVILAIDHREGAVINELIIRRPDEIDLWEAKRHYHALFRNRFESLADGTRFIIRAEIDLHAAVKLLQPFLYDYARRRIERFQVEPIKVEAEARALVHARRAGAEQPLASACHGSR